MQAHKIAELIKGRLLGADVMVHGIAPIRYAGPTDLSFIIWPKDINFAKKSRAACIVADTGVVADYADSMPSVMIAVDEMFQSFVVLKTLAEQGFFLPMAPRMGCPKIGKNVRLSPHAIIENGAIIGDDCVIGDHVVIHHNVTMGNGCAIKAHSVLGSEGFIPFGVNPTKNLPCLGSVIIDDEVSIGALCTIDRGLLGPTRIKSHTLMDNMVHIGHDAFIGKNVVIAAQTGIAGFAHIDDNVTIGGQVGIVPFAVVGEHARINGKSLVHCDIKPYEIWSGNPSLPHSLYLRAYGRQKRMNKGLKQ